MLHLLLRTTGRASWIAGKQVSDIHFCSLNNLAGKSPFSASSSPDLAVFCLVDSCGLSQTAALSVANKINLRTTSKCLNANSVVDVLRLHGLTTSDIANVIVKFPRLLLSDAESTIKPKLEFFLGVGVSNDALVKLIRTMPSVLMCSLEKKLRPNFEMLKTICGGDRELRGNIKKFIWLLNRNFESEIFPNLRTLQEHGVPPSHIARFAIISPHALPRNPVKFCKLVVSLKEMGFVPSSYYFLSGLRAICQLSKTTWQRKFELYQSLGWSTEETISAFKKFPTCMTLSDEKIKRGIGVFTEKLNWTPSFVAINPYLLSYSVEKNVVPRHNVMNILASKGLERRRLSMTTILNMNEKVFLEKYVMKYKDHAPEILEAYRFKLDSNV